MLRPACLGLAIAALCGACAAHSPAPQPAPLSPAPLFHEGPLTDYVPYAGLRWLVVGRPQELTQNPLLLGHLNAVLTPERLVAFATSSGVHLYDLTEGCIAGFDYGTLYLGRTGKGTGAVRTAFEARLVTEPIARSPRASAWRITGLVGNTPESLFLMGSDFFAISAGDPLLARVVEGFALQRFKKTKPALQGQAFASLPDDIQRAPLRFYAPGPFTGHWSNAAQQVFARTLSVAAGITPADGEQLHVRIVLAGAFGPDTEETRARLVSTWSQLQDSAVGHILNLDAASQPISVNVTADQASLDADFPVHALVSGVAAATTQNVTQLLQLPPRSVP